MSALEQFENDRERQAVGERYCEGCGHAFSWHGPDGCEGEVYYYKPCACQALAIEPEPPTFCEALARLGRVFAALRESTERHES